jgi:putative ABC transport system permease protein
VNRGDLLLRLKAVFSRPRMEDELDEELRCHLEFQTSKYLAAGMGANEAQRRARVEFGAIELAKEECRDERRVNAIDNFIQDVHYAIRGLRRDPMLTLTAMLTLAICIGANTTVFSLVNSIILRPLPYPQSERLYWVSERMGKDQLELSHAPDYYSFREQNKVFEDVAAYDPSTVNWTSAEKAEQLDSAQVAPSFFNVLSSQPLMGRYLARSEEGPKAPPVAVLSYSFWRSRMGSDPNIVGKNITLDGLQRTVIGVMPQGFDYPRGTQVWEPLPFDDASQRPRLISRPMWIVNMVARLRPNISQQQLDTDLDRLAIAIRREYPKEFTAARFLDNMNILARPLERQMQGDLRPALLVLSGAVALVLLIACANLANLLLARATARERELAVRMALGSGRARIVRQVLTESLTLALPGGLTGIWIAALAIAYLNASKPFVLQSYPPIVLDIPMLVFTFTLTFLTGLVFGIAPAFAAAGISIQDALKSASHMQSGGKRATALRHVLVVAELGLSLVLLIGAGLLARSFIALARTDLGFSAQNLLTLRVNLVNSRYATVESRAQFYDDLLGRILRLPMVQRASVATDIPLSGERHWGNLRFQVAGRVPLPLAQRPTADTTVVSGDFFRALGIPLRNGRTFDAQDSTKAADSIVINEAFAKKILPGEDPIGRYISSRKGSPDWRIVGVVGTIRSSDLGADPPPLIYRCTCQGNSFLSRMGIFVKTTGDARKAIRAIEEEVSATDRNTPVFDVKTMEDRLNDSLASQQFQLVLIGTFALIAIVLAAVGVYGVMSYLVTLRTREIGIRVALGARLEHVLRLVLGESFALTGVAIAVGLFGAWALSRYLKSMLYGVTARDGFTFAIMPVVLAGIAIAASLVPALRASRIDPTTALREE